MFKSDRENKKKDIQSTFEFYDGLNEFVEDNQKLNPDGKRKRIKSYLLYLKE